MLSGVFIVVRLVVLTLFIAFFSFVIACVLLVVFVDVVILTLKQLSQTFCDCVL